MPSWILAILVTLAAAVPVGVLVSVTFFGQTYTYQSQSPPGSYHGAPAPLVGAGLPLFVLIGGGYWAFRRFRRKTD
jgi:hypothetical protein